MLYPGNGKPLFIQLKDLLLQRINEGEYAAGDQLPSERQLCDLFGISRVTVRLTLAELVKDGVLEKRQGKGNFVASKRIENRLDGLLGFAEEFAAKGLDCETRVLRQGYVTARRRICAAMGAENDTRMFELVRLIYMGRRPLGLSFAYLPQNVGYMLEHLDFGRELLYRALEKAGYHLQTAEQSIMAVTPSQEEAELLQIRLSDPLIGIYRTAFVEGGFPILHSRTIYRGDRYRYTLTLDRQPDAFSPEAGFVVDH